MAAGDLDLGDEGAQQGLLGGGALHRQPVADAAAQAGQHRLTGRCRVGGGDRVEQLGLAGEQGLALVAEGEQARAADVGGHGLVLERLQVAVDALGDAAQVPGHGGELGLVLGALAGGLGAGLGDGVLDPLGVGVDGQDRLDQQGFELVGGQAFGRACPRAVALAGVAGVVAVALAPAGRGGAHEAFAAVGADQQAGKQVLGAVGGALGVVVAPVGQKVLDGVEQRPVDQVGCGAGWYTPRKWISPT